jgi:protein-tyrosine phosphatase
MSGARADPLRHVELSGCFNFRDLGGYPTVGGKRVRWRRLFRADGLARLDASDCSKLAELGLATVIDLRTAGEVDERGRFPEGYLEFEYHHLPLAEALPGEDDLARYGEPSFVGSRYRRLFTDGERSVRAALEVLAGPDALPAVFHCSAGKDRTGVLAAVVLGLLGVPDELIVEDYALSGEAMRRLFDWLRTEYAENTEELERYAPAVVSAYPESMAAFLESLHEERGSFDDLAESLAVSKAVESLRGALLEEP